MSTEKKLGIWMDHTAAHFIEYPLDPASNQTVLSDFTQTEKRATVEKSEHSMHNTKQHDQLAYFKEIGRTVARYNTVIVFGPTHAKSELLNYLKADHHFSDIKIKTIPADKMTPHEQQEFVREYFSQPINL